MQQVQEFPLVDNYVARYITPESFSERFREHRPTVFADSFSFDVNGVLAKDELESTARLRERLGDRFRLHLGIFRGDEFVGWSYGRQESDEKFYMVNTGILPAHQGKGIYKALLPHVLELIAAEGFQLAYSRHSATNNRVIVPKLRAGFIITSLEISDMFGVLVHLSYFFNSVRRRAMDVRAGEALPDATLRKAMGLDR